MKSLLKCIFRFSLLSVVVVFLINIIVIADSKKYIYYDISELPEKEAVIILGAFIRCNKLSKVLEDRLDSGLEIYNINKSQKILLSGDCCRKNYDEVNGMRIYILSNYEGVPREDIFFDNFGCHTYDSIYRAREVFEIKNAIIVTHEFHINRAVYTARALGIDAVGFSVNEEKYHKMRKMKWKSREVFCRVKSFLDVMFRSNHQSLKDIISVKVDGWGNSGR